MLQAFGIVFGVFVAVGAALRLWSYWRRQRWVRQVPAEHVVRLDSGVSMKVLVQGAVAFAGMNPRKANITTGDLLVTRDRLLITSSRGLLVDIRPNHGRKLTSARSTGPNRFVVEGEIPAPGNRPGLFRIEMVVDKAEEWGVLMQPFVEPGGEYAVAAHVR